MNQPRQESRWTRLKVVTGLALGLATFWFSATLFAPAGDAGVVEVVTRIRGAQSTPRAGLPIASAPDPTGTQPEARLQPEVRHNPFGPLNLRPPASASLGAPEPAKAAAAKPVKTKTVAIAALPPAPAPAPVAPPLPFTAIGSIEGSDLTSGQPLAFLQRQDTLLIVRKGESIGQLYRVESVSSEKVEFTYLPLNQRQWLSLAR